MTNDRLMLSSRETPIEKDNPERALTLLAAVKRQNWDEILSFQEFNGRLPMIEVFALKCLDDRCSLAAFLFPFELSATDEFLHQQLVPDCDGPTAEGYWGTI